MCSGERAPKWRQQRYSSFGIELERAKQPTPEQVLDLRTHTRRSKVGHVTGLAHPLAKAAALEGSEHRPVHGQSLEAIDEFLAEFAALIEPVEVHFQPATATPDPNDEMVLETAINGRANALVTYNVADFAAAAKRFKISVLSPADLLKKVKAWVRLRIH